VWAGNQGPEDFTLAFNAGCTQYVGTTGSEVCDICDGTYAVDDAGTWNATYQCTPVGSCSFSPRHVDIGTLALGPGSDGGSALTYSYNFGSLTAAATAQAAANVCGSMDAGLADAGPSADPFRGVWTGAQGPEAFTLTFNAGCTQYIGTTAGQVCDVCNGTYSVDGAGTWSANYTCNPVGSCSFSPPHADVGTLTLGPDGQGGTTLTYNYSSGTLTAVTTDQPPPDVCAAEDAGVVDASAPDDAAGSPDATLACKPPSDAGGDPYAGAWIGYQGEKEIFTFSGGTLTVGGEHDACTGTYDPSSGAFSLACAPTDSQGYGAHHDTGTCDATDSCDVTCTYDWSFDDGSGSGTAAVGLARE
jgi:hypothetical protein